MARIVVTGGAGFIGSHVVRRLTERGHRVVVVDDLTTGSRSNIPLGAAVALVERDVNDVDVAELGDDVAGIVHLAAVASVQQSWEAPTAVQRRNLGSTLQVIEWARRLDGPRIVFASSAAVYGNPEFLPVAESARAEPLSPYGLHKLAGEIYLRLFARQCNFSAVSLRFFNVYGPRQSERSDYAGVISKFARLLMTGSTAELHGGGDQTRDFVHVADVADATMAALRLPLHAGDYRCFNVGTQRAVSVAELLQTLETVSGVRVPHRVVDARPGDIRHSVADIQAAVRDLEFRPKVDLAHGLADYFEWLRVPEAGSELRAGS
jgi:UDP-glucose 4-epimerase